MSATDPSDPLARVREIVGGEQLRRLEARIGSLEAEVAALRLATEERFDAMRELLVAGDRGDSRSALDRFAKVVRGAVARARQRNPSDE